MKRKSRLVSRGALIRLAILVVLVVGGGCMMISMPGKSYQGALPPLTEAEVSLRDALKHDVEKLGKEIGERNLACYADLQDAAAFIQLSFEEAGYEVLIQEYEVRGKTCRNLAAERTGAEKPDEIVLVGSHYDSVEGSRGANDNGTGIAGVLALARHFSDKMPDRTVRFVAFVNEEPPYFLTETMGSMVYAKACRARGDHIVSMMTLETIGYYSDEEGSQVYPWPLSWFYPSQGNFIAFVGNVSNRRLVRRAIASFRSHTSFPSEGAAVFGFIPGVGWSDHWSFWQHKYPGIMVTDTAPYRYPHYHSWDDTPDKVDFDRVARVMAGITRVVEELADE